MKRVMLSLLPSAEVVVLTDVVTPAGKARESDAPLIHFVIESLMAYKSVSGGFPGGGVWPPSRRQ